MADDGAPKPAAPEHDALFDDDDDSSSDDDAPAPAAAAAAKAEKADATSAYDDEGDEDGDERGDDGFIVGDDGDNAGIMEEYAKQKQDWHDEEDANFEDNGPAAGAGTGAVGAPGESAHRAALRGSGRQKVEKMSRQEAVDTIATIVNTMFDAAEADDASILENEPAFEKLRRHEDLIEKLKSFELKDYLLERDAKLLEAFARWLRPSAMGLCALGVRAAVYEFLNDLDIDMERDLSHNDLGKVLMALRKNPLETEANRRRITKMVEKWTLKLQEKLNRRRGDILSRGRKRKVPKAPEAAPDADADASGADVLETNLTTARAPPSRPVFSQMKVVQMGTDKMRRKQARLSKRAPEPEKRGGNSILAQLRKAKAGKKK